jgi:hypothetical protein
MTAKEFALVVVRLFGLWVLYVCIVSAERTIGSLNPLPNAGPEFTRFVFLANLFDFLLRFVIGALLAWKPHIVANRLPAGVRNDAEVAIDTTGLVFTCFSVTGLVFLIQGLAGLVYHGSLWAFTPSKPPYEFKSDWASIVTLAFQAAMGLFLLLRLQGIVKVLHWARAVGIQRPEEQQ